MEMDQYVLGAIYVGVNSNCIVQVVEFTQEEGYPKIYTNRLTRNGPKEEIYYGWSKNFAINIHAFREATKEEEQIYYEAQLWRVTFDRDYLNVQIGDLIKDVETNLLEEVSDVPMAIEGIKCGMLKMYKAYDIWDKSKNDVPIIFSGFNDVDIFSHFDQRLKPATIAPKMKYPAETNSEFDCKIPIRF